eukprot:CAMPEP_0181228738 /NCGR_PEP_ID=MMETSP1096-20121128/33512_1 /TAXON_ID=156174 ORGANISM="Chrysochromulina ericina, Strain CCMP281" /NCGR_SAMPLE_ID=MMETSP1096 /ASSEMBLY_ACC=CAM_ASM_000453 /LENGTH=106 /DNA_ID=CAMNT_0023322291 /DNA_START=439 /DNA_END=756 /DNA_ORIENTATION=+
MATLINLWVLVSVEGAASPVTPSPAVGSPSRAICAICRWCRRDKVMEEIRLPTFDRAKQTQPTSSIVAPIAPTSSFVSAAEFTAYAPLASGGIGCPVSGGAFALAR